MQLIKILLLTIYAFSFLFVASLYLSILWGDFFPTKQKYANQKKIFKPKNLFFVLLGFVPVVNTIMLVLIYLDKTPNVMRP